MLQRVGSHDPEGDIDFWKWANAEVEAELGEGDDGSGGAGSKEGFDLERQLSHVHAHLPEHCAAEVVDCLRQDWQQLDPESSGKPTRQDVARSVWAADKPGNGPANMPRELPPRLERKVTETMELVQGVGDSDVVSFPNWVNHQLHEKDIKARILPKAEAERAGPAGGFDLDEALDHMRQHLPEVCRAGVCVVATRALLSVFPLGVSGKHDDQAGRGMETT